jgi:threonine dehydratase
MILREIYLARKRIKRHIKYTPLDYSAPYSDKIGGRVYLKLENTQITGSFKIRGALNKILKMDIDKLKSGIVTASAGNHGKAVAYSSQLLGIEATIFVPKNAPPNKVRAIKEYGGKVIVVDGYYEDAERKAKEYSEREGLIYVSPYNDNDVIAGQGTLAIEILEENQDIDSIIVPVGGGGLISGISLYTKKVTNDINIIGVQSTASPVMYESLRKGRIVNVKLRPTIAEGLHGQIDKDSITLNYIKKYVDEIILVDETDIEHAIVDLIRNHKTISEGAGAVGIAAINRYPDKFRGQNVAIIISGGNIDYTKLKELINRY